MITDHALTLRCRAEQKRRRSPMQPVFAYLDPATGTLIISGIVGAFAAVAMVFKRFWYQIKGMFSRKSSPEAVTAESRVDDN